MKEVLMLVLIERYWNTLCITVAGSTQYLGIDNGLDIQLIKALKSNVFKIWNQ